MPLKSKMTQAKLEKMIDLYQRMTNDDLCIELGICICTLYKWRARLIKQNPALKKKLSKNMIRKYEEEGRIKPSCNRNRCVVGKFITLAGLGTAGINNELANRGLDGNDVINIEMAHDSYNVYYRNTKV
jgi:hypothetical protein